MASKKLKVVVVDGVVHDGIKEHGIDSVLILDRADADRLCEAGVCEDHAAHTARLGLDEDHADEPLDEENKD